jgi:hypothetical protein
MGVLQFYKFTTIFIPHHKSFHSILIHEFYQIFHDFLIFKIKVLTHKKFNY